MAVARSFAAAHGCDSRAKLRVSIKLADSGEEIVRILSLPQPEATAVPQEASSNFAFSAKQKRILVALAGGPLKGDSLAEACGWESRSSLFAANGRGMRTLIETGHVVNSEDYGYKLTAIGEERAGEFADG